MGRDLKTLVSWVYFVARRLLLFFLKIRLVNDNMSMLSFHTQLVMSLGDMSGFIQVNSVME